MDIAQVMMDLNGPISDEDRLEAGTQINLLRRRLVMAQSHIDYLTGELEKERSFDRLATVGVPPRRG
jgi:hypothetical protein